MKRNPIAMKHGIAFILIAALAAPATGPAQIRRQEARPLGTTMPPVARAEPAKAVVPIGRVPDSALEIHGWQGVVIARAAPAPPGGISSAGAAVYVSKSWAEPPQPKRDYMCAGKARGADTLDLSAPRRHGFRLAAFTIEPLPPPRNYTPTTTGGPVRRAGSPFIDADGKETGQMAQAARIRLSSTGYQFYATRQAPLLCFTGYRVSLSLYGPVGVDPFTGKAVERGRVN